MHAGDLLLNGPVWWFFVFVLFMAGMLSVFVVADSIVRVRRGRYRAREPWWVYTIPQAVFLLVLLGVQLPVVPNWGGAVVFVLMPFALAEQFTYLLRVVFPKPSGEVLAEDDADQPAWDEDEPAESGEDVG